MMFQYYKIDIDEKDFRKRINELDLSMNSIARRMMSQVSSKIRRDSRRKERSQTNRTGELAKAIGYKANNDFTAVIYARKFYASFIENGVQVVLPKKRKYLTFQIDGQWKKVESVSISPKPFLKPVIDDYFGSNKAVEIMNEVLQKALEDKMGKE
jgi:hypothetical protein